jgi:hypothetical protein
MDGYLQDCLLKSFEKSGFVLQDIVNEFGRRLDYSVESGLYQGKSTAIGFDGIWADGSGHNSHRGQDNRRLSLPQEG